MTLLSALDDSKFDLAPFLVPEATEATEGFSKDA